MIATKVCEACGVTLPEQRRGRPRLYCTACVPPGTGGAAGRAWRRVNPDRTTAYNVARRRQPVERICVECGSRFMGRPNKLTCSSDCGRRHRGQLRWARARGAA